MEKSHCGFGRPVVAGFVFVEHWPGADRCDADARLGQFVAERFGELLEPGLAALVQRQHRKHQRYGFTAHVDDLRALDHHRDGGATTVDRPGEIGQQRAQDLRVAGIGNPKRFIDCGIVDQHVDRRTSLSDLGKGRAYRVWRGHVAGYCQGVVSQGRRYVLNLGQGPPEQDYPLAVGHQAAGQRAAKPRARSSYDDGFRHALLALLAACIGPPGTERYKRSGPDRSGDRAPVSRARSCRSAPERRCWAF